MIKFLIHLFFKIFKKKKAFPTNKDLYQFNLNLKQDSLDTRDHIRVALPTDRLPEKIDDSEYFYPVKNQGIIGSCNSFAGIDCIEYLENYKNKKMSAELSEMYLYWRVRQPDYENTFPKDSGATGREIMKVLNQIGAVPELVYPYEIQKYNNGPNLGETWCEGVARFWKIKEYQRCYSLDAIKTAKALHKPVWLGIPVQQNIREYGPNSSPLEFDRTLPVIGGHAVGVVGYDDSIKALKVRNSWGTIWGNEGYGWISYDYLYDVEWFDAWTCDI